MPTLVLGRKLLESIQIGPDVSITVVKIDRGKVRLGITAPVEVPIWRTEVAPHKRNRPAKPAGVPS